MIVGQHDPDRGPPHARLLHLDAPRPGSSPRHAEPYAGAPPGSPNTATLGGPAPSSTWVRYSVVGPPRPKRKPDGKQGQDAAAVAAHTAKEKKQAKRDKKVAKTKSTKDM